MKKRFLFTFFVTVVFSKGIFAQGLTTGSISGKVTDSKSSSLLGATILVVHQLTNAKYSANTKSDGRFDLPNVKVGGPYKITVSYTGFAPEIVDDVMVVLGENLSLDLVLKDETAQLQEVVVKGKKGNKIMTSNKNGSGISIDRSTLDALPSISRSMSDFTRLVPQAGAQGMLGKGGKSNNVSVDGAAFNNAFGLGSEAIGGLPGGNANAQPISLDAIDQISVELSPYNAKIGGFTGASVNAVTRSGDNEFRGSVYNYFRNQGMVGDKVKNAKITNAKFEENTFGFRLGGPIIKDKLFFFANYEQTKSSRPGTVFKAAEPGLSGGNIATIKTADLDALGNYLNSTYGYNAGSYQNYNLYTENKKFLVKLDWNISDKHKMNVRYNQLKASADSGVPNALNSFGFNNNGASRNNDIYSLTAELSSTLSNKVSNRFFASYTSLPDYRKYFGSLFPQVIINDNGNTYTFGTNNAARGNRVDQKIFQIQNDVTINLGKHKISTGISYQLIDLLNEFTFNPQGTFIFNSLPSFYNSSPIGTITPLGVSSGSGLPTAYSLGYTLQPGRTVTLDKAKFVQFGVYMQDEFFPTEKLKITAGVRADVTAFLTNPQNNPAVPGYNFQNAIGELEKYNTTNTPRTTVLISPRVGFNWDIKGDRTLQLRGGSGIFSGNIPFVYIKTGFINGLNEGAINAPTAAQAAAYPFNPDPRAYIPTDGKMAANYELNFIAPNFKLPQTFRSTLGLDAKLPGNIIASIEAVYSSDINAPYYRNANLNYNTSTTSPDGRLKYTSARINPNITGAYVLDNISKGSQFFLTESISKQFSKDFAVSLSYTYGESKDVYPLRSTIASGAFNAIQVVGNPNVPVENYSDYDLRHRIVGSLNYRISYAKDKMTSSIGIFFEGAQQGRGTYAYGGTGNVNQDGSNANDLIFVPQNQSQINLVASSTATVEQQWDALDRFISNSKYLKNRRGQFAERNGILLPWYYQADIKFSQDFSGLLLKNKNTLQVTVDIINFTNLINKNWGVYNTIANTTPITALSATTFQVNPALLQRGEFIQDNGLNSRYRIQVGVRYSFN